MALEKAGLRTRKLYCYDIRYTLKDYGAFGLGKPPSSLPPGPSMSEALALPMKDVLSQWDSGRIEELRRHRKVSGFYGFMRETLPGWLTFRVPPRLGFGHEIFALAEKRH
jgi:hypothetical protein